MSQNPLNLALRFILELAILFALGYWGWTRDIGVWRYLLAIVLPVAAAILWSTFHWPHETAGSPRSPVPIAGWLRLLVNPNARVCIGPLIKAPCARLGTSRIWSWGAW